VAEEEQYLLSEHRIKQKELELSVGDAEPGDAVISLFRTFLRFQGKTEDDESLSKNVVSDSQLASEGTPLSDDTVAPQITDTVISVICEKNVVQEPETYTSFGQTIMCTNVKRFIRKCGKLR